MSTNKEWGCSVAGCTADDRVCMRMAGLSKGEQPKELVTFIKSPLGTYCLESVRYHTREAERLQVELSIRDGEASLQDANGNEVTPKNIAARLAEYVRGQDYALKRIARSLYYFLLNREIRKNPDMLKQFDLQPKQLPKLNMLMPGPTGSGKTYIWEQVERLFNIPVCVVSVTDVTSSGYVGDSLDDKLGDLLSHVVEFLENNGKRDANEQDAAEYIEKEGAILVLDEIDKKAAVQSGDGGNNRDVSGISVQQELLTFIQGTNVRVAIGSGMQKQNILVSTDNVLFAAMGAFKPPKGKSLQKIVMDKRSSGSGFQGVDRSDEKRSSDEEVKANYGRYATSADYQDYGLMAELLGRLMASHAPLNELSEEDMMYILSSVRGNRYSAYKAVFAKRGLQLEITEEALREIARRGKKSDLNARALDNELSNLFVEVDIEANERVKEGYNYLLVTKDMVLNNGAIIEDGENATFQKRASTELLQVESDGVDDDA